MIVLTERRIFDRVLSAEDLRYARDGAVSDEGVHSARTSASSAWTTLGTNSKWIVRLADLPAPPVFVCYLMSGLANGTTRPSLEACLSRSSRPTSLNNDGETFHCFSSSP